jgi:predicted  nucleic acid-binding Zn-ribbon protein
MPHQCLKCGKVFEEGSAQLLKGCPNCGGNRFFFTKEPLDENERQKITEEVGQDINSAIMEMMETEDKELLENKGDWVNIKPKHIKKAMKKHLSKKERVKPEKKEDIDIVTDEKYRATIIEKIKEETDHSDTPETIDIEKPGKYKLDLKGLLEEEPIIIQKDGSYTIHLASVFKMIDKEKKDE